MLLRRHFWIDNFPRFFFEVGYGEFPERRCYWISLLGIVLLDAPTISWILWTPSLWYHEVSQDELKNNKMWLFEKNSLMTVERQTLIVFASQNNGSMDVLSNWMRGAQIWHVNDMHVRCALFWLPQGVDTWQPTLLNMAGLKNSSWKWPRKYNRCFASQVFITLAFWWDGAQFWGMFHDI